MNSSDVNRNLSNENACEFGNYFCSDKGLLLPLMSEYTWPIWWRASLYFAGLIWCFLGVAIVADIFMCSIEKITSHVRKIKVATEDNTQGFEEVEVKVWNDTVANLTLMALGSSAPEILLACIETVGNGFVAGDLGPGTIVGSAAFNLFCITGICIAVIPKNESRRIAGIKVFVLTSLFSLFAYIWLVLVLVIISPNEVEVWEAFMTLALFPILVILAYVTDQNCFRREDVSKDDDVEAGKPLGYANRLANFLPWNKRTGGSKNQDRLRKIVKELKENHPELSDDDLLRLATIRFADEQPKNRLWYRINATKQLGGNPRLVSKIDAKLEQTLTKSQFESKQPKRMAIVELASTQTAILEKDQKVTITILRYGNMANTVHCRIETIDGTAEAMKDYIPTKMDIVFGPKETEKNVDIEIIDDDIWEPDEVFFVKLSLSPDLIQEAILGSKSIQEITILNDDEPGMFEFEKPSFVFKENVGFAEIPIVRSNGADGKVTLHWKTEDISAEEGRDYKGKEGIVMFESGEMKKNLEILILNNEVKEKDHSFKILLVKTDSEGAKIGRLKKTVITLVDDDEFNNMMTKFLGSVNLNVDMMRVETTSWSEQFKNAMNVNGGDIENATSVDYVMHFLTFAWKIIFAFIPPTNMCGGWLSFFISLVAIGLLTAVVGDLATIFGCLVGLKDSVTAITFVAMGTSVPDLFASKQAAMMEKTADNSIGNVTGSNSVNVFLGLGLPWVLAALYWSSQGKPFEVPAGTLAFSVVVFVVLAIACISILFIRRYAACLGRAELGGPMLPKVFTAIVFVAMWIIYILLSAFQAYDYIQPNF